MGSLGGGGGIALGIIVGLLSTSVQSLGLTLQRQSHILEDEKGPQDIRRPPHRRRRWQIGMGMFIFANIVGSSVQIGTLPLPVLSTLQASGLVFNSICATLILGEPFTRWSLWGTMLVCVGAVLIAIFGAIPSPAHKLSELLDLLGRRPFVVWMSLQALLVVSIAGATETLGHFTSWSQDARFRLGRGLAYGCISGILSAHSLLVAKSAVELVVRTIVDGDNQFVHWQSWMLVLGLIVLALSQLYYLHRGLKLISTSVLYPLVFCIYNIIAILDGLIYFRQTDLITPLHACLIALGTAILLSGVLALSWRLSDEQHTPGVGQSTLAPGLGLVEDTDGEDEEEEHLLGSDVANDDERAPLKPSTYETFGTISNGGVSEEPQIPPVGRKKSIAPSLSTQRSRWTERAEIWGELEDRDNTDSPPPNLGRRRSSTLPVRSESTALLSRRGTSNPLGIDSSIASRSAEALDTPSARRAALRRRRKSTGFPGFTARKTRRKSSGGIQDTLNSIWRGRWWKNKGKGNAAAAVLAPGDGTSPSWPAYTDDLEAGEGSYRDVPDSPASPSRRRTVDGSGRRVEPGPVPAARAVREEEEDEPEGADPDDGDADGEDGG